MGSRSRCKTGRDLGDREGSGPCCRPQQQQCGCPLGTQPSLSVSQSFKPQTLPWSQWTRDQTWTTEALLPALATVIAQYLTRDLA